MGNFFCRGVHLQAVFIEKIIAPDSQKGKGYYQKANEYHQRCGAEIAQIDTFHSPSAEQLKLIAHSPDGFQAPFV